MVAAASRVAEDRHQFRRQIWAATSWRGCAPRRRKGYVFDKTNMALLSLQPHTYTGAQQGGVRVVGWPPWILGSIEIHQGSNVWKTMRKKQTIVAKKPVSRPNNASNDRRSLQKIHRKQSVCSKFHQALTSHRNMWTKHRVTWGKAPPPPPPGQSAPPPI